MHTETTRRQLLRFGTHGALTATLLALPGSPSHAQAPGTTTLWPGYPRHDLKLVAELVGVSHFNEARVRELVKASPELVNAAWDWGFGDWGTPLGAAAHTGQRAIAEFLLTHGARIDLFAAAMLGYTEVVKGFITAQPGIQRTLGPHGISLLAHAKAGDKQAADTVAYLEQRGNADGTLKLTPLTIEERRQFLGQYVCTQPQLKLICRLNKAERLVVDVQTPDNQSNGRLIHYLGSDEFFPAGVPSVRLRFQREAGQATSVTILGTVPELTLQYVK